MNFNDISLTILFLFPGFVFAHFYLKAIDEFAKAENLKLLSLHSFFAALFVTSYSFISLLIIKAIDLLLPMREWFFNLHLSSKLLCFFLYYFLTFIIAGISGYWLMKKEAFYKKIKPQTYWNKML